MRRAELLGAAREYLFEALNGLEGATKALDRAGLADWAETARVLHQNAEALHFEIRLASLIAHRAENPDAYDENGRWVGRPHGAEPSGTQGKRP
jgi:hypothetical protein